MLGHRGRRCPNIKPALVTSAVFAASTHDNSECNVCGQRATRERHFISVVLLKCIRKITHAATLSTTSVILTGSLDNGWILQVIITVKGKGAGLLSDIKSDDLSADFTFYPPVAGPVYSCAISTWRRAYSPAVISAHCTYRTHCHF